MPPLPPTHTPTHALLTCQESIYVYTILYATTIYHIDGAAGLPYMQWIISIMYTSDISALCKSHLCQSYSLPTFLSLSVCLNSFQFVFLSVSLFGCLHCPTVLLDVCLSMCLSFFKSVCIYLGLTNYLLVFLNAFSVCTYCRCVFMPQLKHFRLSVCLHFL